MPDPNRKTKNVKPSNFGISQRGAGSADQRAVTGIIWTGGSGSNTKTGFSGSTHGLEQDSELASSLVTTLSGLYLLS